MARCAVQSTATEFLSARWYGALRSQDAEATTTFWKLRIAQSGVARRAVEIQTRKI
ncbi:hypothetical protein A2U01_0087869, partial [Trifolium medium]|nr:hypothetical protein [Trifolium medium]